MKYFKHITNIDPATKQDLSEKKILYYRPEHQPSEVFCIPHAPGNNDFDQMIAEVDAGTSEIVEVDSTDS